MTIIELNNVGLEIDRKKIVEKISLQLQRGKITTLIGPNGGGKTSIARIILGIIKPSVGKVLLSQKLKKIKIGYMPQKVEIDKTIPLSALDFITLSTQKIELDQSFFDLAERLKVSKILNRQVHELSGGQFQKILFLRSIVNKPELLVLDEPTQFMDIAAIEEFYQIIDDIRKAQNCAILLISHDLHTVMQKTDFVFCINLHICCHGAPQHVNQHPDYLSLLGRSEIEKRNNVQDCVKSAQENSSITTYQHYHDHKH